MSSRESVAGDRPEYDSATALNCGICCRCGNGTEGQCRAEGLQQVCGGNEHSATAPKRGIFSSAVVKMVDAANYIVTAEHL